MEEKQENITEEVNEDLMNHRTVQKDIRALKSEEFRKWSI